MQDVDNDEIRGPCLVFFFDSGHSKKKKKIYYRYEGHRSFS